MVLKDFEITSSHLKKMDQNVESQRSRAYSYPFTMVSQSYPAAGPAGSVVSPFQAPHLLQPHLQQQQQKQLFHGHSDNNNMSFQAMQNNGSPLQYSYIPQYPAMATHYHMHPANNAESTGTYYQAFYPSQHQIYAGAYLPSFAPHGYPNYLNNQAQYTQYPLSPVQSIATTVESPGFSQRHELASPTTTFTSTASKKTQRTSPVIACTPLNTFTSEEELEMASSGMSDYNGNIHTANVYIKGLPSTMTDKQLKEMVTKFGEVISSKAIIDRPSGVCKGFGFAKFSNLESAEACIKDFKEKNYEATIARDSFYSRLKDLADLQSTNLYVSNLPATWDDSRITSIFDGYEPTKCRLLVGPNGRSRGVAFVTFRDRNVCDEIIEKFNGRDLKEPMHHLSLQVRYADTVAQKKLKKEKKEVGQFPKKSVMMHHAQAMQAALQKGGMISAQAPLRHRNEGWDKKEAPTMPGGNAPPTPPQSVISGEEDTSTKSDKGEDN